MRTLRKTIIGGIATAVLAAGLNLSCDNTNTLVIASLTKILVVSNDEVENAWIAANYPLHLDGDVTSWQFDTWSIPDSVPLLSVLNAYDVVFLYEDGSFGTYSDSIGHVMYQYVMGGGNLVLGTFYWQERSDGGYEEVGWGDLEMIDPIIANDGDAYLDDTTGTWIKHPLTNGLDSIICYYGGGYDSLRPGATAVAWWKSGDILIAFNKPNGRIVAVTLWPYEVYREPSGLYTGFYRAWENAFLFAAYGTTRSKPSLAKYNQSVVREGNTTRPVPGTRGGSK